ncbi:MAG: hypothetical protein QOH74_448 [Gaiellales bacterium]|nr:hypothetical protein [Gaiellales bacterium]
MVGRSSRSQAPRRELDVRLDRQRTHASQREMRPARLQHDSQRGCLYRNTSASVHGSSITAAHPSHRRRAEAASAARVRATFDATACLRVPAGQPRPYPAPGRGRRLREMRNG